MVRAMLVAMARKTADDDLLAPVTLAVGQEDLLLDRAVREVVAAARAADADTDVRDLNPEQLQPGTLAELTSPSLFAERKVVVVRNAQDLSADTVKDVKAYLGAPAEEITLVLVHAGAAKGKALLDAARKAGAREVACPKMTKPADRLAFVRGSSGRSGGLPRPRPARRSSTRSGVICGSWRPPFPSWSLMWKGPSTRPSSGGTTPGGPRRRVSRLPTGPWKGGRPRRWRR